MGKARRRVRRRRRSAGLALAIAPLIDVVFLLLIYFLLVGRFERPERTLRVEQPTAARPGADAPDDPFDLPPTPVLVRVVSTGIGGDAYTWECDPPILDDGEGSGALSRRLAALRGRALGAGQPFLVRPVAGTRWEHALGVFATLRRAGFSHVGFMEPAE